MSKKRYAARRFFASVSCMTAEIPFPLYAFCFLLSVLPTVFLLLLLLFRRVQFPGMWAIPVPFFLFSLSEILSGTLLAAVLSALFSAHGGKHLRPAVGLCLIFALGGPLRLLFLLFGAGTVLLFPLAILSALLCIPLLLHLFRFCESAFPACLVFSLLHCVRLLPWLLSLL